MKPRILLVNPPIYDFSAYDFWLKPYGMLRVAGFLRGQAEFSLLIFSTASMREYRKQIIAPIHGAAANFFRNWKLNRQYSRILPAVFIASACRVKNSKRFWLAGGILTLP
jgi:hypothetical protein